MDVNPKSQSLNPKQSLNPNSPMFQTYKFGIWNLRHWDLFRISDLVFRIFSTFTFLFLSFTFICKSYALNLDKIKTYFLSGDYSAAISEGEKLLANYSNAAHSDELYYILALSYMKDENYLRASDIFEIILKEFKRSAFRDEATLGLGDTYFLRGGFDSAQRCYEELIRDEPNSKLKAQVFYRLSQVGFKKGDANQGVEYLNRLKTGFPLNPELKLNQELLCIGDSSELFYTIQVGSFASSENARNLSNKLINSGYDAYIQEVDSGQKKNYRVRVGRLKSYSETAQLQKKLSYEGYPTKIYP